jgi:hypothetical protein
VPIKAKYKLTPSRKFSKCQDFFFRFVVHSRTLRLIIASKIKN